MTLKTSLFLLGLAAVTRRAFAVPVDSYADNSFPDTADSFKRDSNVAPTAVLRPVQPPAWDQLPIVEQVVPQSSINLHFSATQSKSSPSQTPAAVVSFPRLTYPAINAVGVPAITSVECGGNQARVSFVDQQSFDKAATAWPSAGLFTLITFAQSCGTGIEDATHDFILVHSIAAHSPETLSIVVNTEDIPLEHAVGGDTLISVKVGSETSEPTAVGRAALNQAFSLHSISKSVSKSVSFSKYPANAQSPFGPAYQLYSSSKLSAYCVGCGADGGFVITASFQFSIFEGLQSGGVSVGGHLNGAAVFGLVGRLGVTVPFPEITLAQLSIEGLSVPGIVSIGPIVTIGAGGSVSVDAAGQLEVGAKLHWPNVRATLDFVRMSSSGASGWTPTVEPVFSADGSISSTLDMHLTNKLAFGVAIPLIKFNKQVSLVDQPGVKVTAGIQGTASFDHGQFSGGFTGTCQGVAISAKVYNNLFADLFGLKRITLFDWISSPLSQCIVIAGKPAKPAALPNPVITHPLSSLSTHTSTSAIAHSANPSPHISPLPSAQPIHPSSAQVIHSSSAHTTTSSSAHPIHPTPAHSIQPPSAHANTLSSALVSHSSPAHANTLSSAPVIHSPPAHTIISSPPSIIHPSPAHVSSLSPFYIVHSSAAHTITLSSALVIHSPPAHPTTSSRRT